MIPQSFIQDLLARVDIVDVVGRSVQLKKGGQNFLGLCPFHGEKSPSFTVSPSKQFYHCFGCGAHGSAIGFLMEQRGFGYVDAIRELAQQVGMQVPESRDHARDGGGKVAALSEVLKAAADFYRSQLRDSPAAIEYLKARGLTGQTAARFGLGFAPDAWQPLRAAFERYDEAELVEAGLVIADEGKRYDRFRGRIMIETINKMNRISRQILQETGTEPDPATLAVKMEMPEDKIRKILKIAKEPISMETPIGDDDDSHLGDFIEDQTTVAPVDAAQYNSLSGVTKDVLDSLTPREAKVLRMRFGIEMSTDHTLEEVGKQFDVTRERIRQIEAKALRKLRHPSRSRKLRAFLEGRTS